MKLYIVIVFYEDSPTREYEVWAKNESEAIKTLEDRGVTLNHYAVEEV